MRRLLCALLSAAIGCTASNPDFVRLSASEAAVCVRSHDGLHCATWAGTGFGGSTLWSRSYSDDLGWGRSPSYWATIRTPDLDGDGRTDACGRSADGLVCAVRPLRGPGLGAAVHSPAFGDADGFFELRYATTLQFADVDGDRFADACARGPDGVRCALGRGDGTFGRAELVDGGFFADANGWSDEAYGGSLEIGDLDADGRADLCVRGAEGVYCARSLPSGWETPVRWSSGFADAGGWNKVGAARSLALVDVDGDRRADLCGRGPNGAIVCALSDGSALRPPRVWSAWMPSASDDDEVAYATLRFGDLDGNGSADVCDVVGGTLRCARSTGHDFEIPNRWDDTRFAEVSTLDHTSAWSSLALIDLNQDGKADVCTTVGGGIACAYSTGRRFEYASVSAGELVAAGSSAEVALLSGGGRRALAANPTAVENDRPGTPGWWVPLPAQARNHEIEGYTDELSYDRGAIVTVRASTSHGSDAIEWSLYRTGYYQGIGARRIAGGRAIGKRQPLPPQATTEMPARCDWSPTFEVRIPADAVSGVYVLRLDNSDRNKSYLTTFVVRDDARVADLIVQRSDFTDVAYNNWDGQNNQSSWYFGKRWVSWDRPFRSAFSLGGLFSYSAGYFTYEYSFVRWLEREGFDVKYVSNADVHADAAHLHGGRAFLSVGHDEYWSAQMRDHVEEARDAGVHLGFFSSDTVDSVIRFQSADSHSFSANVDHSPWNKNEWADKPVDLARPPHDNPSDTLTGTHYVGWCAGPHPNCSTGGDGQPFARLTEVDGFTLTAVHDPVLRYVAGGAHRLLTNVLGYEYEGVYSGTTALPFRVVVLAANDQITQLRERPVMVAYETAAGAKVFNAGSMHWAHALDAWAGQRAFLKGDGRRCDGDCFFHENRGAQQLTMNVLVDFGARPSTPTPGLVVSGACDWTAPDARCIAAAR